MKLFYTLLTLVFFSNVLPAQESCDLSQVSCNMDLLATWHDESLPVRSGLRYNDIWGYSADGREYAIVGSVRFVHVWDVTETPNIVEVARIEAPTNAANVIWRDFKTYGNYAYCVADEGSEGLVILDLSDLPNTVTVANQFTNFFTRTHNIFVDEPNGRLYAVGCTSAGLEIPSPDMFVFDIATDPENPVVLGKPAFLSPNLGGLIANGYVHDVFVKDNIAYCSHGSDEVFGIWDMTDAANPVLLDAQQTAGYNHSSWLTEDGNYAIYAEETNNIPLGVMDVSDLNNISIAHTFKFPLLASSGETNNIAHNPFIKGDLLYVSYYEDGVQVFDISDPLDPTRVGFYDTEPNNTDYNGTDANWGVFPFFESGKIVGSDTNNGLFVLKMQSGLAVSLEQFTAAKKEESVELQWVTLLETRNIEFEIERKNAKNDLWENIGEVKGRGNAAERQLYTFVDLEPTIGNNHYRLAQTDASGEVIYSPIEVVNFQDEANPVTVFPTLIGVDKTVSVAWNTENIGSLDIAIFDLNGRLVLTKNVVEIEKGMVSSLDLKNLAGGVYLLDLETLGQHKIVVK